MANVKRDIDRVKALEIVLNEAIEKGITYEDIKKIRIKLYKVECLYDRNAYESKLNLLNRMKNILDEEKENRKK